MFSERNVTSNTLVSVPSAANSKHV